MYRLVVKKVDRQGRIVLPKEWRDKWGDEVVVVVFEDKIEILPRKRPELDRFFDIIEIEVKTKDLKRELMRDLI